MNNPGCDRITFAGLTDYAAGELPQAEAEAIEAHIFSCAECAARAAELDALVRAIGPAVRSAEVGGFLTDTILNRLAREGVRARTFALSPGAVVPCAVWEHDELMVLRLHADVDEASEFTISMRAAGAEVSRATGEVGPGTHGDIIFATPAAWVRQLPIVEVEILLTARAGGEERPIGSYTLVHGGSLQR